jgi:esterase/lipase superfamily enzyme
VRWGHYGLPLLIFPTAAGGAWECAERGLVGQLEGLIDQGRMKVYSVDSIAGRAWLDPASSPAHRAWMQNQFDGYVYHEVVPAIMADCRSGHLPIIAAGASIGAFNAVATMCRHPDVFYRAIGLSGTYDIQRWLNGEWYDDFYFSSPLHYLPGLNGGWQLDVLRERFIVLAFGEGRWEDPGETWRLAHVLGTKRIANRVDPWGPEFDHDWPTWRAMLPVYAQQMLESLGQ